MGKANALHGRSKEPPTLQVSDAYLLKQHQEMRNYLQADGDFPMYLGSYV